MYLILFGIFTYFYDRNSHKNTSENISQKAGRFHIRWMDVMMKILLPAGFVTLKLTGTFIDFMLGLSNSNTQEESAIKTAKVRDSYGSIFIRFSIYEYLTKL